MIKADGIRQDYIDIVENKTLTDSQKIVKILRLVVELLLNIRTNSHGGLPEEEKNPE